MIALLASLFGHHGPSVVVPSTPWEPSLDGREIVMCLDTDPLMGVQFPVGRVLEAVDRWRSWGARISNVSARTCDYDEGPHFGESWVSMVLTDKCNEAGDCRLGGTVQWRDPVTGYILATETTVVASPLVYEMGVFEHELGHAFGLKHVCEIDSGLSDLPTGFHFCAEGEAAGHIMAPTEISTDPYIVDGVREALRRR